MRIISNYPLYINLKKNYPHINDIDKEIVNFYDSIINVAVGKYKLKYAVPFACKFKHEECVVLVIKENNTGLKLDKLVLCRFLFDGPRTYEVVSLIEPDQIAYASDGTIILKYKKL